MKAEEIRDHFRQAAEKTLEYIDKDPRAEELMSWHSMFSLYVELVAHVAEQTEVLSDIRTILLKLASAPKDGR